MSIRDRVTQFVTYLAKQIYCSKGGIVLGRVSGAGSAQEITVGSGLTLSGTTLAVTGGTFAAASHTHLSAGITDAVSDATVEGAAGKVLKTDEGGTVTVSEFFSGEITTDFLTIKGGNNPAQINNANSVNGLSFSLPTTAGNFAVTSRTDGAVSYNDLVDVPAAVPLTASKVVDNAAARLALTTEQSEGFAVVDADTGKTWMLVADGTPATADDWLQLGDRDIQVSDVNGLQDEIDGLSMMIRTAAQGPPTETVAGSPQKIRFYSYDPSSDVTLTVNVSGLAMANSVSLSVPVLSTDTAITACAKIHAAVAANATVTNAYTVDAPLGNGVFEMREKAGGPYRGVDLTMIIAAPSATGWIAQTSSIAEVGVKTTTETVAELGQVCRVGDAAPYDFYVATAVSPMKWSKMLVSETGTIFPNAANSFVIRNNGVNGESKDADKWELWNSGANSAQSLAQHTVPSGMGRNNWSHLITWNLYFSQNNRAWAQAVDGIHTQVFEMGNEGISMHQVKNGGVNSGFNNQSHMMWAMRPNDMHSATGELTQYQTENPVIQRKVSDICIFREVDGSSTPNSDGWVDLDNPFAVYASDSRNNTVPANGSIAFRTWGTQEAAQTIVFDRASGPASSQVAALTGEHVGGFKFRAWDGSAWVSSTEIYGEMEGSAGGGEAPVTTVIDCGTLDTGTALAVRNNGTDVATVGRDGKAKFHAIDVSSLPVYANEVAALAGGVRQYEAYRTSTGELRYVYSVATDSDAAAYITSIEYYTETPMDAADKAAITAFVVAEKDAGRWTSLKRIFLPVWGLDSANAIDMKGGTAGAFAGTVTHAAGYVQGNGTTGYFNTNASASGLGLTNESAFLSVLIAQAGSGTANQEFIGAYPAGTGALIFYGTSTNAYLTCMDNSTSGQYGALARASQVGILTGSRFGGAHNIRKRITSGVSSVLSNTITAAGNVPTTNLFAMARNNFGTAAIFSDARFGAFVIGAGMSTADVDGFTANLKTLWETVTGLTLP